MKQQVYEKLLKLFEEAVKEEDMGKLKNLSVKSYILRERSETTSASIVKEILNA